MDYVEKKHGDLTLWIPPGAEKAKGLTDAESKKLNEHRSILAAKAEQRQSKCWMFDATGCTNTPSVWVREVFFDFKEDKALPQSPQITSADRTGPVPGFCHGCLPHTAILAQQIYFHDQAVYWGLRPRRWFVSLTDGSTIGGHVQQFDPKPQLPSVTETYQQ